MLPTRVKLLVLFILTFAAGVSVGWIGKNSRGHDSRLGRNVCDEVDDKSTAKKTSLPSSDLAITQQSVVDESCLESIPLFRLKDTYDKRFESFEKNVVARANPVPNSEPEMLEQVHSLFKSASRDYKENASWLAETELPVGNERMKIDLIFIANNLLPEGALSPDKWVSLYNPNPNAAFAMPMAGSHISGNICWSLNALAPDLEQDHRLLSYESGCLESLSYKKNAYSISGSFSDRSILGSYTHFAVNIPSSDSSSGDFTVLESSTQKWDEEPSIRWSPLGIDETHRLLSNSSELDTKTN